MEINLSGQLYEANFDAGMASIVDSTTTAGYVYFCDAVPGTPVSSPTWRVSLLNTTTGQTTWANGNSNFTNIAANRTALAYS